ncbi:hypothetical protein SDC9_117246 [bioreactor metagenome]|uniref:Uncharacterized protein n=1 Tax=bioreactor metagenome TaxID=1076179 RepID=A0A645C023_9ZZZZ
MQLAIYLIKGIITIVIIIARTNAIKLSLAIVLSPLIAASAKLPITLPVKITKYPEITLLMTFIHITGHIILRISFITFLLILSSSPFQQ